MPSLNQENIIGSLIPDVFIYRISLESSRNNLLVVNIDLLINEKISDDLIGSWFDNIDFQKYLKIKIFQSSSNKLSSILSLSQDMLELIDPDSKVEKDDPRSKIAGSVLEIGNFEQLQAKIFSTTKSKILDITKKDKLNNAKEIVDLDRQ